MSFNFDNETSQQEKQLALGLQEMALNSSENSFEEFSIDNIRGATKSSQSELLKLINQEMTNNRMALGTPIHIFTKYKVLDSLLKRIKSIIKNADVRINTIAFIYLSKEFERRGAEQDKKFIKDLDRLVVNLFEVRLSMLKDSKYLSTLKKNMEKEIMMSGDKLKNTVDRAGRRGYNILDRVERILDIKVDMFGRKYLGVNPGLVESIFFKSLGANMDFRLKVNDLVTTMITQIENLLHPMDEMEVEYLLDEARLSIMDDEFNLKRQEEIYNELVRRISKLKGPGAITRKRSHGKGKKTKRGAKKGVGAKTRRGAKRGLGAKTKRGAKKGVSRKTKLK